MAKFKDPIAVKDQKPKNTPVDGKNSPWDFRGPSYDQRHSCFINAGTDYGVGYRQPVGSRNSSVKEGVPFGRIDTPRVNEAY